MIYADHAATTSLDTEALRAMLPYLKDYYGNASSPYSFGQRSRTAVETARSVIAECINADTNEIIFTSGGTESDNLAIKGLTSDHINCEIVVSSIEHKAVKNAAFSTKSTVKTVPADSMGVVTPEILSEFITDRTRLVSIMATNNEIGTVEPIDDLSAVAHAAGTLFHTDAVQMVGHLPVDVKKWGVDLLSASAHKFGGPKGVGFLYCKSGTPLHSTNFGGFQEGGLRAGTENIAGIVGMAVALQNSIKRMNSAKNHLEDLEKIIISRLIDENVGFCRNGGGLPGLMSLSFYKMDGEAILHRLDLMDICISTGAACDGKTTEISPVLRAIGLDPDYAMGTIRISFGYENSVKDAEIIAKAIISLWKEANR